MLESAISPMNNSNIELILKSFLNAQRRLGVFRMILYCSEELFSLDQLRMCAPFPAQVWQS
jgi:hypothetical protein